MKVNRKFNLLMVAQVLALSIIVGLIFIDDMALNSWLEEPAIYTQQDLDCDLHFGPCEILLENGSSLSLSISPQTIPLMKPLTLLLKTKGFSPKKIRGKVYATNMNMGIHPITLYLSKNNDLTGEITLPTCIAGNMKWRVELYLPKIREESRHVAVFLFQTTR